jgi:molecular chaperone GrpE (heat shock protein)
MEQGERIQYHRLTLPVRIKDDIEYIPINRNGQEIPPIEVEVTAPVEIEETTPYNADEVFDSKQNYDIEFHSSPDTKIVSDKEVSSPMDNPNIVEEEEIHHDSLENEQSTKLNPFDHIDQDLQLLMNRYIQEEEEIEDIFYQSHKNEFAPYSRNLESLLETDESHKADNIVMERLQLLDDDEHIIKEINLSPIEREKLEKEEESYSPFDLIEEIKEFKHPTKKEKK